MNRHKEMAFLLAFVFVGFGFLLAHSIHADTLITQDGSTTFSGSFSSPCSGDGTLFSCSLSPDFQNYTTSSAFNITGVTVDWIDIGSNNCDGEGRYGAIITSASSTTSIVATSTNTALMGCAGFFGNSASSTTNLVFPGSML